MLKMIQLVIAFLLISMALPISVTGKTKLGQELMSEASVLIDAKSGQILYEENADKKMYPASITKIVTGIMAIEQGDLTEEVRVSEFATEQIGTRVYLLEDEKVSLRQLVEGLLINSGNDAGTAIAEHLAGDEEKFAKKMNEFVHELGATNTHFTNPHGLFDEEHYTTALDMAIITQYALKNNTFRDIVSTKELEWVGEGWETTLYNHHRLLWDYEGTIGVKNGFVSQAGFTLVTAAERDEQAYIAVTLKNDTAQQSYQDTQRLLDYGFNNYKQIQLDKDEPLIDQGATTYYPMEDTTYAIRKDMEVDQTITDDTLVVTTPDESFHYEVELIQEE
ncbi:D-alanyl-D-alanine carboxypeptidase family protein, partial [Bacillus sp. JCM 19041]|uniref:D-alanyl-D-alanine carboxypeptidase family protein n=1 Tax=Bacillus sp. JCM 19041 TaxID=1460637 RepID=UPI0006D239F1